eukprot:3703915-Rhodomonas_salina.2
MRRSVLAFASERRTVVRCRLLNPGVSARGVVCSPSSPTPGTRGSSFPREGLWILLPHRWSEMTHFRRMSCSRQSYCYWSLLYGLPCCNGAGFSRIENPYGLEWSYSWVVA